MHPDAIYLRSAEGVNTLLQDGSLLNLNHPSIDEKFSAVHVACII